MVLTAMGSVINKCITVAEILKRQVAGLHQWNQIKSIMLEVHFPLLTRAMPSVRKGRPCWHCSCAAVPGGQRLC